MASTQTELLIRMKILKEQAAGILGLSQGELEVARRRAVKSGGRIASSMTSNVDLYFVPVGNSGYYELCGVEEGEIDEAVMNGFHE